MRQLRTEGLSIRAAMLIGFVVMLALWLFAWVQMSRQIVDAQKRAAAAHARYNAAQETLANVRARVLMASVAFRDALLDPDVARTSVYRQQLEQAFGKIQDLLSEYVPVSESAAEREQFARLRAEVGSYQNDMLDVLSSDRRRWLIEARELLSLRVTPKRDIVIAISEGVQSLNRSSYLQRQREIADIYRGVQRTQWEIMGLALAIGVAIVVLAVVYAGRLERCLHVQLARDVELTKDLQHLSAKVMTAQEEERRHIARELHDEIGQALTAIKVELAYAQRCIEDKAGPTTILQDARTITDGALHQVRDLSHLLHSAALDEFGLVAALDSYLKTFSKRHGVVAVLFHDGMGVRLAPEIEAAAYRIIQEALTNVARHADAKTCRVHIARIDDRLRLRIEDDGRGFDTRVPAAVSRTGIGLIGIRERASHLQGSVNLESTCGRGTSLMIELPARVREQPHDAETTGDLVSTKV
jgi:signal transduction histidine kinase